MISAGANILRQQGLGLKTFTRNITHYANAIKGKPCMATCPKARVCKQRSVGRHSAAAFGRMTMNGHPLLRGSVRMATPADARAMSTSVMAATVTPAASVGFRGKLAQYEAWLAAAAALVGASAAVSIAQTYEQQSAVYEPYNEQQEEDARFLSRAFGLRPGSLVTGYNNHCFRIVSVMPTAACRSVLYRVCDINDTKTELILKVAEADEVPDDRSNKGTAHSEILALEELKEHNNIVHLRDWMSYGDEKEWYGMVLEYLPHMEPEAFGDKVAYLKGMLQGLAECHDARLVHRDIKRGNVMYDHTRKRAVLIDFDAAARLGTEGPVGGLVFRCGTKGYRAPEMNGESVYNEKVDLWSVGVIMAEMILDTYVSRITEFPHESADVQAELCTRLTNLRQEIQSRKQLNDVDMQVLHGIQLSMSLMETDPRQRPSALEALEQPFFNKM